MHVKGSVQNALLFHSAYLQGPHQLANRSVQLTMQSFANSSQLACMQVRIVAAVATEGIACCAMASLKRQHTDGYL